MVVVHIVLADYVLQIIIVPQETSNIEDEIQKRAGA